MAELIHNLLLQEALKVFRVDEWSTPKSELAGQVENWLGAIQLARKAYPEAEALMLPGSERFFAPDADLSPHEHNGDRTRTECARPRAQQAQKFRPLGDLHTRKCVPASLIPSPVRSSFTV